MSLKANTELYERLKKVGEAHYHHHHPFSVRMNSGDLSPEEIQCWVANRYYYQANLPRKDAAIISNCPVREVRRVWLHRISDHDGSSSREGGIEAWIELGQAAGL